MADDSSRNEILRDFGLFAIVAGEILGFTGAGIGLGYLGWTRLGLPWWVLIVTSLAGLALAMWQIARAAARGRTSKP